MYTVAASPTLPQWSRYKTVIPYPDRIVERNVSYIERKTGPYYPYQKVIGQLVSVHRGLNDDEPCAEVLRRLAAARGAINSLMGELMEDHIINHMPKNSKSAEEAAEDMIQIVRTYLR
jgi:DNA-binding FrmR family transcriptional regulator